MDIVVTAVLGIFFYNLFLQPILTHSPHFRTLLRENKITFWAIIGSSFVFGVNFIRFLYCRSFGCKSVWNDFNEQFFFVKPLNNMANFTVIMSAIQFILNFVVLFSFPIGKDAWTLAIFGLGLNAFLCLFQVVRFWQTKRFVERYNKISTNK
jgi:hypothetical protein